MLKKGMVNLLTLILAFLVTFFVVQTAYAGISDAGFRWKGNTAYFRNYNTDWSGAIVNAASKYNSQTDLNTSYVTSSGSYRITFYLYDYGPNFPVARTVPYSGSTACAEFSSGSYTGNCAKTGSLRADKASIYYNSYFYIEISSHEFFLPLHEAGHAFGMGHAYCIDESIMRFQGCGGNHNQWSSLKQMDKDWINDNY